jgi:hypothetical protein
VQKQGLLTEARHQAREKLALDMQDLQAQLAEQKQQLEVARAAELDLRKKQRELEQQKQALQLEVARTLDEERGKICEAAKLQAAEEQQFRLAEKEKLIGDLQKQIASLKQKAEQGSVQLQGEVLELALEDHLGNEFIYDVIEPVAKGQRGADVLQRVRTNSGLDCGVILWETKRAKAWGKDWPAKLKEDQRAAKAELAVIVSQTLPPGCRTFGQVDGVWVCDFACVLPLAAALRQGLIGMAAARQAETGKQTKMEQLYRYLAGTEFRQRVEALVEAFVAMKKDLDDEKRAFTKRWAAREKQIEGAITHTAMLYGGIQGIVGQNALPDIKPLQLPFSEDNHPQAA